MLTDLTRQERKDVFSFVGASKKIRAEAAEKDWWVVQVIRALFSSQFRDNMSFKGGTSLSKGWGLIERFSEDIDIAINRKFLGLTGELTKTQISDKLRRASCSFVRTDLKAAVETGLAASGIPEELFNVDVEITPVSTTDPEKIYVRYESVFASDIDKYVKPRVVIEAGARSIFEPTVVRTIRSFVSEILPDAEKIPNDKIDVRTAPAQRTFLEKIFLLHEEFHKEGAVRIDRMSRHLYDMERMMDTDVGQAINDRNLYLSIVDHRRRFIGLKGFDYNTLMPQTIDIIPPENIRAQWAGDYRSMQESMIFGESLSFNELIKRIKVLNDRINCLKY